MRPTTYPAATAPSSARIGRSFTKARTSWSRCSSCALISPRSAVAAAVLVVAMFLSFLAELLNSAPARQQDADDETASEPIRGMLDDVLPERHLVLDRDRQLLDRLA